MKQAQKEGDMRIPILTFGAFASIIAINSVLADTVVTSKQYVDTEVGKKQNTIPAAGTNNGALGISVVMYTNTAGTVGERGIYSDSTNYTAGTDANKLVTASALNGAVSNLPTMTTSKLTCMDSPDCTLWTVADQEVYGEGNN